MAGRLKTEIKQRKPFKTLEQEAFLNLVRTADALVRRQAMVFKHVGLSHPQYNVLRILRGAGPNGLACRDVCERMITRDPDLTRLVDRLEVRGLVARGRDGKDRRVVTLRITPAGLRLLKSLDEPVTRLHVQQLGHLGAKQLRTLIQLLEVAREKAPSVLREYSLHEGKAFSRSAPIPTGKGRGR
jgi:DNA-binding MarR family transcriptional regulator